MSHISKQHKLSLLLQDAIEALQFHGHSNTDELEKLSNFLANRDIVDVKSLREHFEKQDWKKLG